MEIDYNYILIKNSIKEVNTKKNLKSIINSMEKKFKKNDLDFDFCLIRVFFEIINWKIIFKETNKKENIKTIWLLKFIKKKFNETSFMSIFPEIFKNLENYDFLVENIRDIFKILKLGLSIEMVISYSFYLYFFDSHLSKVGLNLLKEKIKEFNNSKKPTPIPKFIVEEIGYKFRLKPDDFSDIVDEVKIFLKNTLNIMQNKLLLPISFSSEPFIQLNEFKTEVINNDFINYLTKNFKFEEKLEEIGPILTNNPKLLNKVLSDFNKITEENIFNSIMIMIKDDNNYWKNDDLKEIWKVSNFVNTLEYNDLNNDCEELNNVNKKMKWNFEIFLKTINEKYNLIDWKLVLKLIDNKNLKFDSNDSFQEFIKILNIINNMTQKKIPKEILESKWENPNSENLFFKYVFLNSEFEIFDLNNKYFSKNLIKIDITNHIYEKLPYFLKNILNQYFSKKFVKLIDNEEKEILKIINSYKETHPEIIMIFVSNFMDKYSSNKIRDLFLEYFQIIIENHTNNINLLEYLWTKNQDIFIENLNFIYCKNKSNLVLSKTLDITQNIKDSLLIISKSNYYEFSIPLSFMGIKKDFLRFENWIDDCINCLGINFIEELLKYIINYFINPLNENKNDVDNIIEKSNISFKNLSLIFQNYLLELNILKKNKYIEKISYYFNMVKDNLPEFNKASSLETENKANTLLDDLFFKKITINEFIDKLMIIKNNINDKELLSCIIINLMSEYQNLYRFKDENLIIIMAEIYGNMILKEIVDGKIYMVFLKIISDSLEKSDSFYKFGLKALNIISNDIKEIDINFYQKVFSIQKLRKEENKLLFQIKNKLIEKNLIGSIPQELLENVIVINEEKPEVEKVVKKPNTIKQRLEIKNQKIKNNSYHMENINFNNNIEKSISKIIETKFISFSEKFEISENIKKKISLIFNSLNENNINEKFNELIIFIENNSYINWIAAYLVFKRIPFELNNHKNYKFIVFDKAYKGFDKIVMNFSFVMINLVFEIAYAKNLLNKEEINITMNIGKWIGRITLERNFPILTKDLNVKSKLLEAYKKNKLNNVIRMVCSIFEFRENSLIFQNYNPYIMSIFDFLRELKNHSKVEENEKVYIEDLFIKLKVVVNEIFKFQYLEKNKWKEKITNIPIFINSLPNYIKIDNSILEYPNCNNNYNFKQYAALALEMAIKEINLHILKRSVKNALYTTRVLIVKDFGLECDENQFKSGAEAMITNLAGNLTLINCREPLRFYMGENLEKILINQTNIDERSRKEIKESISQINLDLACAIAKKKVIADALEELANDEVINNEIQKRKKERLKGNKYINENIVNITQKLPDLIKPDIDKPYLDHLDIYKNFLKENLIELNINESNEDIFIKTNYKNKEENIKHEEKNKKCEFEYEKINDILNKLEIEINKTNSNDKIKNIHIIYSNLSKILQSTNNIENHILNLSIKILEVLFKPNLTIDKLRYYTDILVIYSNYKTSLPKNITEWIFNQTDNKKYNSQIIIVFLRRNLIHLIDFDLFYSKNIDNNCKYEAINCIINILKNLVIEEKIFSILTFIKINEKLCKIDNPALLKKLNSEENIFLDNLKQFILKDNNFLNNIKFRLTNIEPEYLKLQNDVDEYFQKPDPNILRIVVKYLETWFKSESEQEMAIFIRDFEETIIKNGEKMIILFFCYSFDIVINKAYGIYNVKKFTDNNEEVNESNYNIRMDYSIIDSLSKMIIILLKTYIPNEKNKKNLLEKILTSLIIVLNKYHYFCNKPFNQKPFFKILFNILYDLNRKEYNFGDNLISMIQIMIQTLHILQPIKFPGFAFSWLQWISSSYLMKNLLNNNFSNSNTDLKALYNTLVMDLIIFYKEIFSADILEKKSMKSFYKGTLRFLLILLHDFPDFLCEYSIHILEELPEELRQIRNIILSAYPKNMKIPNPFESKSENNENMPIISNKIEERIYSHNLHNLLFSWIKNQDSEDLDSILNSFYIKGYKNDLKIHKSLLDSFILYIPSFIYSNIKSFANPNSFNNYKQQSYLFLIRLLMKADYELKDKIISSIFNNIKYPNLITYYFSNLILLVFAEVNSSNLQEQIIRNLFERLIIEKPHPWGILSLLSKIFFTKKYNYENKEFYKENVEYMKYLLNLVYNFIKIS